MKCPKDYCTGIITPENFDIQDSETNFENEIYYGVDVRFQCPICKDNFQFYIDHSKFNNIDK